MICFRYDFVSYSQQVTSTLARFGIVYDMLSIRFCQLFTTRAFVRLGIVWLFMICFRYDFVSYSQQVTSTLARFGNCLWYAFDTILSAIHNKSKQDYIHQEIVYDMLSIRFCQRISITCSQYFKERTPIGEKRFIKPTPKKQLSAAVICM